MKRKMSRRSSDDHSKSGKKRSESSLKSDDSKSSYEEGDLVDYDLFSSDQKTDHPKHTKEYYYQEYPYVKPKQSDFDRKEVREHRLFDELEKVNIEASSIEGEDAPRTDSILVTGFGMRNVDSFQRLIKMSQEERKKWELRKLWRDEYGKSMVSKEMGELPGQSSARTETTETTAITDSETRRSSSDFLTQTETTIKAAGVRDDIRHLDYLLGLEADVEEEPGPFEEIEIDEFQDEFKYSSSKAVRDAQRYLRVHRIFECYQFIVAHLLSANADNPIEFILNLLNRCLLYRSGLGEAPLLYEQKHINKLFDLMDRLQTGFIDILQYGTGMKTLGICSYNEDPDRHDGLVAKETFVEEAYDAEVAIFDDIIKRRPEKNKTKYKKLPPAFDSVSVPSLNPPYFIPLDLLRFGKDKAPTPQQGAGE